jgi:hypothetical protein
MTLRRRSLLPSVALLALALSSAPGWADSFASSASSAASQSVGSSSTSIEKSSDSSSRNDDRKQVAAGDYEVVEMVALAERPGQLRLKLQPPGGAEGDRFYLYLPEATANSAGLVHGQRLKALERPYGLAFARADAAQAPFFLVVQDTWLNELPSKAVTL